MKGDRSDIRRRRLLADNRCIRCGEKLAFDDIGVRQHCARCTATRSASNEARLVTLRAAKRCPVCAKAVEDEDFTCCATCRKNARERFAGRPYEHKRGPNGPQAETRWKDLDAATSCQRCGLRGEHVCVPSAAVFGARRQSA